MYPKSDHYNGKIFQNPVPTEVMMPGSYLNAIKKYVRKIPGQEPSIVPGTFRADPNIINKLPESTLRITWLGHSSTLIELDGKRFLTDPLWSQRASPLPFVGPKRFFDNPLPIDSLPEIDCILLSHDHYDHLDKESLLPLISKGMRVITMLGVGQRLINWGADRNRITELDWWQEATVGNHKITALPARHFSGRGLTDRFRTLWGSFSIRGPRHHVYFGADSGYWEGFKTIGEKLGPFDLTMLDSGAYGDEWPLIHMGPENAIQAHRDLRGRLLMPIHWGTFKLAYHPWKEPVERVLAAAKVKDVKLMLPAPGETREIGTEAYHSEWWMDL